ncbi:hypothetical protein [Pseudokineococcus lusitanus]|uniref:Uncharacterized protein n=1 Tax=Pseudokineococcus lusitanus TaxID=763993 RepID=A0A3N1HKG0_9ACTN|nr:hypothetical protein [Pseudokineococcus lusitanus]ROP42946.1 hypothetical protein EDC03_2236 [Pseudokineococcus lusitanus]
MSGDGTGAPEPGAAPGAADGRRAGHGPSGPAPAAPRAPRDDDDAPVLPRSAGEDSARAWGDDERGDDDERFLRERPPHW